MAVRVGDAGPGAVRQTGPGEATEAAQRTRQEPVVAQELSETCVLAMEPQVEDFNAHGREISMTVVSMLQKLEELPDEAMKHFGPFKKQSCMPSRQKHLAQNAHPICSRGHKSAEASQSIADRRRNSA